MQTRGWILSFAIALAALLPAHDATAATPPVPAQPLKIMVIGDSISEGTYRGYMYHSLEARGFIGGTGPGAHFQMVGQRYWGDVSPGALNPWPTEPWDRGEGHGGFASEQIVTGRWGEGNNQNRGLASAQAAGAWNYFGNKPDVVTILLGTNDLSYYLKGRDAYAANNTGSTYYPFYKKCLDNYPTAATGKTGPNVFAETIDDLRNLIGWLRGTAPNRATGLYNPNPNPNVTILLSTGIPTLNEIKNVAADYNLAELKDHIAALANGTAPGGPINTATSRVQLVDVWTGFDTSAYLDYNTITQVGDPTHPNEAGHLFIGGRFADAVAAELPEPASLGLLLAGVSGLLLRRSRARR